MNWMIKWASPYPVFVKDGAGAHFNCVDGHKYLDLCLGDTGAMTGHAPPQAVQAIVERIQRGTTFMLPSRRRHCIVAELLSRALWLTVLANGTDCDRRQSFCVFAWPGKSLADSMWPCTTGAITARSMKVLPPSKPDGQVGPTTEAISDHRSTPEKQHG